MSKPKILILEGADKVGKTSLYQAYRRATAYQPYVIDRFIGSNIVYDKLYGRETRSAEDYLEDEAELGGFDVFLAVLTAPHEIIEQRIRESEKGVDLKVALANFIEADRLFREYFEMSGFKKALIDTSEPIEKNLEQLLELTGEERVPDPGRKKLEDA